MTMGSHADPQYAMMMKVEKTMFELRGVLPATGRDLSDSQGVGGEEDEE